ncbi:efflux RND transporter periplasmic adaptor subunit (plasmid) [Pantoea sp. S-LA4]|jgi:RND family efflux transporter MFP subunit|uniref:efflux RND transporter periplasmic adaptor subunit n=1 Tax=Pantoea TaxID=53335 RepID=UPI001F24C2AF|nr:MULTISPECIES: efflux RND transporter periplasmic adaptor subunit [Pantoea]UIL54950.1 efflux RND transporter periplasmic adaptor subunit [Pantoea agglomerans]
MTDLIQDAARQVWRHLLSVHLFAPIVFLLLGIFIMTGCRDDHAEPPVAPLRPVKTVIAPAFSHDASQSLTGEVHAHQEVALAFRLDGRVIRRTVELGDSVTAGQPLATLEDNSARNQLSSARADLESARAAERVAALNLHRMRLLMPGGAIARSQLDSAQADFQSAQSRRLSSEAALKNAQDTLSWTQLRAPSSGRITAVNLQPGQVVSAGQSVMTLAAGDTRDAVFDLAEPSLIRPDNRMPLNIALLSDPGVQVSGSVRDISPQADPQTRTWRLRVTLNNPPATMALGATVMLSLPDGQPPVIALPASALTRAGEKPALWVVDRATRRLQLRPVVMTRFTAEQIFISTGIQPGETVVTAGVSTLQPGEQVALSQEAP